MKLQELAEQAQQEIKAEQTTEALSVLKEKYRELECAKKIVATLEVQLATLLTQDVSDIAEL
jgi:hypothetical protein